MFYRGLDLFSFIFIEHCCYFVTIPFLYFIINGNIVLRRSNAAVNHYVFHAPHNHNLVAKLVT